MNRLVEKDPLEARLLAAVQGTEKQGPLDHGRVEALSALEDFYESRGCFRHAEPLLVQVISVKEKIYGVGHSRVSPLYARLSDLYENMGLLPGAESVRCTALGIDERDAVQKSRTILDHLVALARILYRRGRKKEAGPYLVRAEKMARIVFRGDPLDSVHWLTLRGDFSTENNREDKARFFFEKALALCFKHQETDSVQVVGLQARLGRWGDVRSSVRSLEKQRNKTDDRSVSLRLATEQLWLVSRLLDVGGVREALRRATQALALREKFFGSHHPLTGDAFVWMARTLGVNGRFESAESFYLKAWNLFDHCLGPMAPALFPIWEGLAGLYYDRDCFEEADECLEHLEKTATTVFHSQHPTVRRVLSNRIVSLEAQDRFDDADALRRIF